MAPPAATSTTTTSASRGCRWRPRRSPKGRRIPNWRPHVVHANDWPTALTPAYIKWKGLDVASILTIHNLAYQGLFDRDRLGALAIPEPAMSINGVEFHGRVSFLKAGIFYASQVTTVSATYAQEITMSRTRLRPRRAAA